MLFLRVCQLFQPPLLLCDCLWRESTLRRGTQS